ncbi:MAG: alpha/beta fold hydrolase [Haloferacaceae archaeon]
MSTFVLVHGSWHDGSAYEPIADRLEARGHDAYAPTIAGHGPDADRDVDHADCTRSIVEFLVDNDLKEVVLHGHSFGGTVIAKVAEAIPERLDRLVFQNAFVPADGNSLLDEVPPSYRTLFSRLVDGSDDDTVMLPFEVWRERFINDADPELARSAYEELSPEPFQPFRDELEMSEFFSLDLPTSYINATEDTALPQSSEWCWHPRMSSRLELFRLVQLPGSHEVVFTDPDGLTDAIVRAGRE